MRSGIPYRGVTERLYSQIRKGLGREKRKVGGDNGEGGRCRKYETLWNLMHVKRGT